MKKVLFILMIVFTNFVFSQADDFQVWSSLNLRYNINKKSNINVKQSLRTFQNSTYWKLSFTEVAYLYKINKQFKVSAGYRYAFANKIEYVHNKQRFFIDLSYVKKVNDLEIKFRPRMQIDMESTNNYLPFYVNRELFELSKNLNKTLSIYASTEVYFALPSSNLESNYYGFFKHRFTGGVNINITNKSGLKVFYRYQHEKYSTVENTYILGLTYKYEFN